MSDVNKIYIYTTSEMFLIILLFMLFILAHLFVLFFLIFLPTLAKIQMKEASVQIK